MTQKAYHGGSFFNAIGQRLDTLDKAKDIINADVLDAWFNPAPAVTSVLSTHLNFLIKTSPPTHCEGLIEIISEVRNIDKKKVIVGGGSSDLIFLLFPKLDGKVLILDPTYGEYSFVLEKVLKREVVRHMLKPEDDFMLNIDKLIATIEKELPAIVVIVNPNSPTGQHVMPSEMIRLIERFPDILFVVDEAYIDYIDRNYSLERLETDHLIVIKSMSKVYALSGVRVAYMVAPLDIVEDISPFNPPWPVSLPAQLCAIEALKYQDYYDEKYFLTRCFRNDFSRNLQENGFKVINGCANFLLIDFGEPIAERICAEARSNNIFLRNCDSMSKQFGGKYIRTAVKTPDQNELIVNTLCQLRQQ